MKRREFLATTAAAAVVRPSPAKADPYGGARYVYDSVNNYFRVGGERTTALRAAAAMGFTPHGNLIAYPVEGRGLYVDCSNGGGFTVSYDMGDDFICSWTGAGGPAFIPAPPKEGE